MVTKSMAKTPFGIKLIYKADGECIWSEYVSTAQHAGRSAPARGTKAAGGWLSAIWAGLRLMLPARAA